MDMSLGTVKMLDIVNSWCFKKGYIVGKGMKSRIISNSTI